MKPKLMAMVALGALALSVSIAGSAVSLQSGDAAANGPSDAMTLPEAAAFIRRETGDDSFMAPMIVVSFRKYTVCSGSVSFTECWVEEPATAGTWTTCDSEDAYIPAGYYDAPSPCVNCAFPGPPILRLIGTSQVQTFDKSDADFCDDDWDVSLLKCETFY